MIASLLLLFKDPAAKLMLGVGLLAGVASCRVHDVSNQRQIGADRLQTKIEKAANATDAKVQVARKKAEQRPDQYLSKYYRD